MKKNLLAVLGSIVMCIGLAVPQAGFAGDNSINLGGGAGGAFDASGSVVFGEFEHAMGDKVSLYGRVGSMSYTWDDGWDEEEGDATGIDIGVRVYPSGGMKGFFFGGAIGWWSSDWTFIDDKNEPYRSTGEGSSDAIRLDLELGGRIPLGSGPVSLMPAVHLGNYFGVDSSCTYTSGYVGDCSRDASLQAYGYASLMVGIAF